MTDHEDKEFQKQEYKILVELIKHQHTRVHDFNKTILTVNTILVSACAILLKVDNPGLNYYLIPLCVLGIAISFVWFCVLQRMGVDTDLRWFQLRNRERLLSRPKGIFSEGYMFFKDISSTFKRIELDSSDRLETLKSPRRICFLFPKLSVFCAMKTISLLFVIPYGVFIILVWIDC